MAPTLFRPDDGATTMDPVTNDQVARTTGARTAEPLTQYTQRVNQRVRAFDRRHPLLWDLHVTGFG